MSDNLDALVKFHEEILSEISEYFDIMDKKVIDFGFGSGIGTVTLSLMGIDIVGVDNNQAGGEDCVVQGTRYATLMGSKAKFFIMDGEKLDFSDNSQDVFLAIDVLEHLENPAKIFEEINRALKPGGQLVIIWQPYYAPYGGHLKFVSKNPWRQLMPFYDQEKYLKKAWKKNPSWPYDAFVNVVNSLNKLTLKKFRRIIAHQQWDIVAFKRRAFKLDKTVTNTLVERHLRNIFNKLPLIPILEEFSTPSVLVILKKRSG